MGYERIRKGGGHDGQTRGPDRSNLSAGKRTLTQGLTGPREFTPRPPTAAPIQRRSLLHTLPGAAPQHVEAPPMPNGLAAALLETPSAQVGPPVQMREAQARGPEDIHAAASAGVATPENELPHRERIEASLGQDLSGVRAHTGGEAAETARVMGAEAYATGDHVVLPSDPSLHTVAHEVTHVLQQRQGVYLKGGVGEAGDSYEQHADAVADRVVRGESAVDLLDHSPGGGRREAIQRKEAPASAEPRIEQDPAGSSDVTAGAPHTAREVEIKGTIRGMEFAARLAIGFPETTVAKGSVEGAEYVLAEAPSWPAWSDPAPSARVAQ